MVGGVHFIPCYLQAQLHQLYFHFTIHMLITVPGHILLFKNFRPARSVPEHIQIGVKFKTEPCRIQYGTDPTMVLAEFRKRFQDKSKESK